MTHCVAKAACGLRVTADNMAGLKDKLKNQAVLAAEEYDGLLSLQVKSQLLRLNFIIGFLGRRGATVENIANYIKTDIEGGGGTIFGGMLKELDRIYTNTSDEIRNVNAGIKLLDVAGDDDPLATWITGDNPCEACEALDGETRRMSEWIEHGLPGTVFADGSNPCELYGAGCNCSLEIITEK